MASEWAGVRINYPYDPNPKTPKLKLPPGSWDTHFHVWGPGNVYPYRPGHDYNPMPAPIEHYLAIAKILGFERGVVVQPRSHGNDYTSVLDAIRKSDDRLKGMVIARADREPDEIKRLHAAGIRGVRVELGSERHGSFDPKAFQRIVQRCADARWIVALHVDPQSIIRVAETVRKLQVPTIIENYASMDGRLGVDQPAMKTIIDLAKEPHVWIKASSAYRMWRKGATYEQVIPIGRAMHAAAPDRTIWGSDWPHGSVFQPGQMPNDGDLVDSILDYVPDETNRRKLFIDNPKRLFDFD